MVRCFCHPSQGDRPSPALIDWEYNAWGRKYPPFDDDNAVPKRIASITGRKRFRPGIILEGGAIDGNGDGIVLTTERCVLNPNRNPLLDRDGFCQCLAEHLDARQVIWLGGEIPGDDTDGHVDQLARFVDASTIVLADFVGSDAAQQNEQRIHDASRHGPAELTTRRLPAPQPQQAGDLQLPASYANFYVVNGGVIVPEFGDSADQVAYRILQECFPEREVVAARSDVLVIGLGAIHCLTQQEPAPAPS